MKIQNIIKKKAFTGSLLILGLGLLGTSLLFSRPAVNNLQIKSNIQRKAIPGGKKFTFTPKSSNQSVKFDVYEPDSSGTMKLPDNVDFWKSKLSTDPDGMVAFLNKDGQYYYNISSVAFQAMNSRFSYPELDLKVLTGSSKELSLKQTKAFKWLDKHKALLNNGSYIWYYNFPLNYNNIVVTSSWPSAFSQAAVIHAYIAAWYTTGDRKWLEFALSSAYAFEVSVDDGGLTSHFDGLEFFEEVPLSHGYSPHILNAHLYTTVMLNKLGKLTGDVRVIKLANEGSKTAKTLLPIYDQGYWTRYDLRPRLLDIPMQISVNQNADKIKIKRITLKSSNDEESIINLTSEPNTKKLQTKNIAYGLGWDKVTNQGTPLNAKEAFFQMYLPGTTPSEYINFPGYVLQVEYSNNTETIPIVSILGFRDKMKEYYKLPQLKKYLREKNYVVEYKIDIKDLQWSYLQRHYVDWHTRAVTELWNQTQDPFFLKIATRWKNYLAHYDNDIKKQNLKSEEYPVKERIFTDN